MENPAKVEVEPAMREAARNAWTFGLLAAGMAVLMPCSSNLTALAALPLGIIAAQRARAVLEGDRALDEATEVYARTGRILGLMSAAVSGAIVLLIAAIVLLYVGMILFAFGLVAAVPPPPPVP